MNYPVLLKIIDGKGRISIVFNASETDSGKWSKYEMMWKTSGLL